MAGLYIHVPFCARKCAYCDFYSLPDQAHLAGRYVDAVLREAQRYRGQVCHALYLGGGTPSLLGAGHLGRLLDNLGAVFDLSRLEEATIEVNPESATPELLATARTKGIDRLSIGVQSLADYELKSVGRVHSAAQAVAAIERARQAGFDNISADLIAGLPGQDWGSLRSSLAALLELGIGHLSLYMLSVEAGTPLFFNLPGDLPADDAQAELFEQAGRLLAGAGFGHYEISNFALPGRECRHNLNYWRGGEYAGLGPAAASHLKGQRYRNRADLHSYLENPTKVVEDVEQLDIKNKAAEEAMLRLRLLAEGLDMAVLAGRYGQANVREINSRLNEMARQGAVEIDGTVFRLAASRVLTSNPVFAAVLGD
ncbi:MAG: radical SAM family heme chaperone HemW [Chloroflexi bacterium]|nr:radical SAM family heme chaperone HemW [Chloroflexota bacterium]